MLVVVVAYALPALALVWLGVVVVGDHWRRRRAITAGARPHLGAS